MVGVGRSTPINAYQYHFPTSSYAYQTSLSCKSSLKPSKNRAVLQLDTCIQGDIAACVLAQFVAENFTKQTFRRFYVSSILLVAENGGELSISRYDCAPFCEGLRQGFAEKFREPKFEHQKETCWYWMVVTDLLCRHLSPFSLLPKRKWVASPTKANPIAAGAKYRSSWYGILQWPPRTPVRGKC